MNNDLKIRIFIFNQIEVNTIVLYDDTKEAVIIDPGVCNFIERQQLAERTRFTFSLLPSTSESAEMTGIPFSDNALPIRVPAAVVRVRTAMSCRR